MKKITLFIAFICIIQFNANSQGCLPEGIIFTSQAQIDSFQIIYPNCTEIEGYVNIGGSDISNLNGLNAVTKIGGYLSIGRVFGFWGGTPFVIGNPLLSNVTGLSSLTNVGGSLTIWGDNQLTDLSGLESLSYVGADLNIGGFILWTFEISYGNPVLANLGGLNSLTTVDGLVTILLNDSLTNLSSLNGLTSAEGLRIAKNETLNNLSGLDNIDANSLSYLNIYENELLSECEVQSICDYLATPDATIYIYDNATGCNSPEEVEEACETVSINEINFLDNLSSHPNPFTTSTTIEYALAKPSTVQLIIYDYLGKQLEVIEKKQAQGKQQIICNAEGLPSGVYFGVLKTNEGMETLKMIKMK